MSGINWNSLSSSQQARFLEAAGLDRLPETSALSDAQLQILTGIVGQETRLSGSTAKADSISRPQLPGVDSPRDWSDIMALVSQIRVKASNLQCNTSLEQLEFRKDLAIGVNKENAQKLADALKKLEEILGRKFSPQAWIAAWGGVGLAALATLLTGGTAAPAVIAALAGLGMMKLHEEALLNPVLGFLKDNPELMNAVWEFAMKSLVAAGILTEAEAKIWTDVAMSAAVIVFSLLYPEGNAMDALSEAVRAVGKLVSALAELLTGKPTAKDQLDRELTSWLAKLQAKMSKENQEMEEALNSLNENFAAIVGRLGDMAGTDRQINFHTGM